MTEKTQETPTFEDSLANLESVVQRLESGELSLTEALEQYEAGVGHLKHCYAQLEQAERKIELLTGVDAQGEPIVEPFDDEALSLEEKAEARSRRRARDGATQQLF